MTFSEAARIMMTKSPTIEPLTITSNGTYTAPAGIDGYNPILVDVSESSGGGIWDMFNGREPLVIATIGPNTTVYVLDMGDPIGSYIRYGGTGQYVREEGFSKCLYAVIRHNGKFVSYRISSNLGYSEYNGYSLMSDSSILMTASRKVKLGATNVYQCTLTKSGTSVNLNLGIKLYLDYLNFSQYDYDDGSHWEETYAWYNGMHTLNYKFVFQAYSITSELSYTYADYVLGNTASEQADIWNSVSKDVIENVDSGFPIINYSKPEDHFANDYYTNDTAINHGYYDSNIAYMAKWGTSELWT